MKGGKRSCEQLLTITLSPYWSPVSQTRGMDTPKQIWHVGFSSVARLPVLLQVMVTAGVTAQCGGAPRADTPLSQQCRQLAQSPLLGRCGPRLPAAAQSHPEMWANPEMWARSWACCTIAQPHRETATFPEVALQRMLLYTAAAVPCAADGLPFSIIDSVQLLVLLCLSEICAKQDSLVWQYSHTNCELNGSIEDHWRQSCCGHCSLWQAAERSKHSGVHPVQATTGMSPGDYPIEFPQPPPPGPPGLPPTGRPATAAAAQRKRRPASETCTDTPPRWFWSRHYHLLGGVMGKSVIPPSSWAMVATRFHEQGQTPNVNRQVLITIVDWYDSQAPRLPGCCAPGCARARRPARKRARRCRRGGPPLLGPRPLATAVSARKQLSRSLLPRRVLHTHACPSRFLPLCQYLGRAIHLHKPIRSLLYVEPLEMEPRGVVSTGEWRCSTGCRQEECIVTAAGNPR